MFLQCIILLKATLEYTSTDSDDDRKRNKVSKTLLKATASSLFLANGFINIENNNLKSVHIITYYYVILVYYNSNVLNDQSN
jgi:hypothetical protein